jgi:hypothetical protein
MNLIKLTNCIIQEQWNNCKGKKSVVVQYSIVSSY